MYRNSPPWPHVVGGSSPAHSTHGVTNGKEDDKESVTGEWIMDKIRMKRNDSLTSDDSLVGQWEAECKQFSPLLSPSSLSEHSRMCLEHGYEIATTDDSDELELATSDSSESDLNWLHAPKPITTLSNGPAASKAKKSTNPRPAKNPAETR